jgi:hypothetical protein
VKSLSGNGLTGTAFGPYPDLEKKLMENVAIEDGLRSLSSEKNCEPARRLTGVEVAIGVKDVLPTQEMIDRLAERIERAYTLRRQRWCRGCSTRRVWSAAALRLWQAHVDDPMLPLDCELYVASQVIDESLSDPWSELAQPAAARRFRAQVFKIVRRLRSELSRELQLAERVIAENREVGFMALPATNRISPLGYYIAAQRAGIPELAERFAAAAAAQHRSCPLYQVACLRLLSADLYPAEEATIEEVPDSEPRLSKMLIVMN